MNRFDQHAPAGTQLDGTAGKGLFDEVKKNYPRGGYIRGLYVRIGAGANKSVTLEITPYGCSPVIVAQQTAMPTGVTSFSVSDVKIAFGPKTTVKVITTLAAGPVFAHLYVTPMTGR